MRRDIIGFLTTMAKNYGDLTLFRLGTMNVALLSHPDLARDVLVTNHRDFVKGRPLEMARRLLGDGLLTSEGDVHKRQRRMIQPAFHHDRLKSYTDVMTSHALRLRDSWQAGATIDVAQEMMKLTLGIAGKTMFDSDVESDAEDVSHALKDAMSLFLRVSVPFSEFLLRLPIPSSRMFHRAKARLDATIYRIIRERRLRHTEGSDLLSLMLAAIDNQGDGTGMTDAQLRDEALIFFLAAHDTTGLALTWTWYLLSQNPVAELELHDEIDRVLANRPPSDSEVPGLRFTRAVFAETLRLFPPGYVIARKALRPYTTPSGYQIPAGTLVLISPYLMHRDPRFFRDPDTFDPSRWLDDKATEIARAAYIPFGGGPRICIGEGFSWLEGTIAIAAIAQRWRLRLAADQIVAILPLLNLRPKYGMRMIPEERILCQV